MDQFEHITHPHHGEAVASHHARFALRPLAVKMLEIDPAFTARLSQPSPEMVRRIARTLKRNHTTPAIIVAILGRGVNRRWIVIDGRARLLAAKAAGISELMAYVAEMTRDQAQFYAGRANQRPAAMLDDREQTRAARLIAQARPKWTSRKIAEITSVSVTAAAEAKRLTKRQTAQTTAKAD